MKSNRIGNEGCSRMVMSSMYNIQTYSNFRKLRYKRFHSHQKQRRKQFVNISRHTKVEGERTRLIKKLPMWVEGLMNEEYEVQLYATVNIRKLLALANNIPIQEVVEAGCVPFIVSNLESVDEVLQFESLWALTNICSGKEPHTKCVVEFQGIQKILEFLKSDNPQLVEQSLWCLNNIGGEGINYRLKLIEHGMLPMLYKTIEKYKGFKWKHLAVHRVISRSLKILTKLEGRMGLEDRDKLFKYSLPFLYHRDTEILENSCWAISYLGFCNGSIQKILEANITKRLLELVSHSERSVVLPALRCVGNIATGTDIQTQTVVDSGGLLVLKDLLRTSTDNGHLKEGIWILSNLCCGELSQITAVLESGIFPYIIKKCKCNSYNIRMECYYCLSNLFNSANLVQIKKIVEMGAVRALFDVLESKERSAIDICSEGILAMFQTSTSSYHKEIIRIIKGFGGIEKLKNLKSIKSYAIRTRVYRILENLLDDEDFESEAEESVGEEIPENLTEMEMSNVTLLSEYEF